MQHRSETGETSRLLETVVCDGEGDGEGCGPQGEGVAQEQGGRDRDSTRFGTENSPRRAASAGNGCFAWLRRDKRRLVALLPLGVPLILTAVAVGLVVAADGKERGVMQRCYQRYESCMERTIAHSNVTTSQAQAARITPKAFMESSVVYQSYTRQWESNWAAECNHPSPSYARAHPETGASAGLDVESVPWYCKCTRALDECGEPARYDDYQGHHWKRRLRKQHRAAGTLLIVAAASAPVFLVLVWCFLRVLHEIRRMEASKDKKWMSFVARWLRSWGWAPASCGDSSYWEMNGGGFTLLLFEHHRSTNVALQLVDGGRKATAESSNAATAEPEDVAVAASCGQGDCLRQRGVDQELEQAFPHVQSAAAPLRVPQQSLDAADAGTLSEDPIPKGSSQ